MDNIERARSNSIGGALERAAAVHRNKVALAFEDRAWTFAQLDRGADAVAARLIASGLEPGERIACYGRNSDAYFLAWLGCVRAGLVHVPINYALTDDELAYIVDQSGARAIVHDPSLAGAVDKIGRPHLRRLQFYDAEDTILGAAIAQKPAPALPLLDEQDLAQIMYTSGTTSRPKGAMMSHGAMLAQYASCIHALDYSADDRGLAALPLYHTAQMQAFTMPQLLAGAYTRLVLAPEPALVLKTIEDEAITSFFAPPTVWIGLLRHPDFDARDLTSLRRLYYGASIMPEPVLQELRARLPGAGVYNAYGQTEIAPVATVLRPEEHAERPTSAGRPVLNVQTRVVGPDMADMAPGQFGEVVHRSPQLLSGYWDKPEETAAAFEGGWFHSGDLGYFDEAGYLYIVDRIKDVINTGGVLVSSREVEEAIYTHPAVAEVAVIAAPDEKWIEATCAVVVLRDGAKAAPSDIIAHARARLAPFKVPKRVAFLDALPKNASGKILKRELRASVS